MAKPSNSRSERTAALLADQQRKERSRQFVVVGAVLAVLLAIGIGTFWSLRSSDTTGRTAEPPANVTDTYSVVLGEPDAPHTVKIYADLACPVCAAFESETGEELAGAVQDGSVKVEYRLLAFLDRVSTDEYSSRALNAAAVVLDTSGTDVFGDYLQLLYVNQPAEGGPGLSDERLIELAVEAGAEESAVKAPIEEEKFGQWVINATDQMSKDGISGTPTVFIDGEIAGKTPAESAQAVLDLISGQ